MDYEQTIDYLYHSAPTFQHIGAGAYKAGLETTMRLDEHFGHPHTRYSTIHVAGTNGKGSVASTLAAILQSAGMKVGLYTSPHLADFRERIRVNGQMIGKQRVVDFVHDERAFFEPLSPSFFELTTALAFLYFAEQEVDVAVIEVGLGGRLDCTNIIQPDVSVITSISFDHQELLGDTLPQIAAEKAGIIKSGVPVVVGHVGVGDGVCETIQDVVDRKDATVRYAASDAAATAFDHMAFSLRGIYQRHNLHTVAVVVDELRKLPAYACVTDDAVAYALQHVEQLTGFCGRWQILKERPLVVCDVGHNADGLRFVTQQLAGLAPRRLHIVFGMVSDKDHETAIALLVNAVPDACYYFTQPSTPRATPAAQMLVLAQRHGIANAAAYASVAQAYDAAMSAAADEDVVFIGGSCYVVGDLMAMMPHDR